MTAEVKSRKVIDIEGWDSTERLFKYTISAGQITDKNLISLIRALAAKIACSEWETIQSYTKKGTRIHHNHLEVIVRNGPIFMYECGSNPYVTATVRVICALKAATLNQEQA